MNHRLTLGALIFLLAAALGHAPAALAHPHVYVTVETTVVYDKGAITGLRQRWAFDEFYTAMAIEGLDANGDGNLDRNELSELAKVNIDGLGQLNYFTTARIGEQRIAFEVPKDFWFEHVAVAAPPGPARKPDPTAAPQSQPPAGFWSKLVGSLTGGAKSAGLETSKVLILDFVLPFRQPVPAAVEGFEYAVTDPQFWIWFDLDSSKGATIGAGAPEGCKATVGLPKDDAADVQRLGEAFFQQAGGVQFGLSVAKAVSVSCKKP